MRARGFLKCVTKLADAFIEAAERVIASMPQVRNFQRESFRNKLASVEFVPDEEVVAAVVSRFHRYSSGWRGCQRGGSHARPARRVSRRSVSKECGPPCRRVKTQTEASTKGSEPTPKLNADEVNLLPEDHQRKANAEKEPGYDEENV